MRLIDADELGKVKFHPLPYTHITPSDVEAESYKRGWNDAIDSIIENAPTIEQCEDAVSRDKVLETYADIYWCDDRTIANKDDMDKIYDKLKALPSVTPQRKRGKWKKAYLDH